jgi:hypothetical protein
VATWDDVRRIALALPGAGERTSRGLRQWTVKDKLFVWERPLRRSDLQALGAAAPDGPILGARVEHEAAKEALLADASGVFFTTPHFDGYPAILVRLDAIDVADLDEVIVEAWLNRAPKKLVDAFLITPIYRAPMRARDRDVLGADHGLAHGLVAIGDEQAERMLDRFAALPEGTFVWTRAGDGTYRLGRVAGELFRDDSPSAREVGLPHARPADWLDRAFAEGEVPAAVAATFARGGRNFQRTHDEAAERRTAELWAAVDSGDGRSSHPRPPDRRTR